MNEYELNLLLLKIEQALEETMGEITPEIESLMAQYDVNFDEMLDNLKFKIDETKGSITGIKDTVKALNDKIKRKEAVIETMKRYIARNLEKDEYKTNKGIYKHTTSNFTFYTVKQPVYSFNPDKIPDEIKTYIFKVDFESYKEILDRTHILTADDEKLPTATLFKTMTDEELKKNKIVKTIKQSLRIR